MTSKKPPAQADNERGSRIRYVRKGHGLSQRAFAEKLGKKVERGAVVNWERGGGVLLENLNQISSTFLVPLEWLANNRGAKPKMPTAPHHAAGGRRPPIVQSFDPDESESPSLAAALHAGGSFNVPPGEIPQVDSRIGLGHATDEPTVNIPIGKGSIAAVPVLATWKIPETVLRRRLPGSIGHLHIIECVGDSMEPTIKGGDFAFIDSSYRVPSPPGIFAIHDGFGQTLKRLEIIPNSEPPKVLIIPDNVKHQTHERSLDEINIIGRYICRLTAD